MTNINEKSAYISNEEKNGITQELVRKYYDYKDGNLYWKIRIRSDIKIGDKAGSLNKRGICPIGINKKIYYLARIIFLWHHGWLPEIVDHKDRNQLNNKIENLRPATLSQNNKNRKSAKNSTSKYLGVSLAISKRKHICKDGTEKLFINEYWAANIHAETNKLKHLGTFKTEIEAALAYNKAAKIYHGEFANLNIIEI